MGDFTDALRRGGLQRERRHEPEAGSEAVSAPATRGAPTDGAKIPRSKGNGWVARVVLAESQTPAAECFRRFALQVRSEIERRSNSTLVVTSPLRQEGKTTTACNLALALASMAADRRIALLDLDLHRPGIAAALGLERVVGIEGVLTGERELSEARTSTELPSLDVFAVTRSRPMAHEILASAKLQTILTSLAASYDAVIIDTPPALLVPDVGLIAPHTGASLAVVRAGVTYQSAFREMLDLLPEDHLIGCFLNDARLPRHGRRYDSYHDEPEPED